MIDETMLDLEHLDEGKVIDADFQSTMLRVFEKNKLSLDELTGFVGVIYENDFLQEAPSRQVVREKLISKIPEINALFGQRVLQIQEYTKTDRIMQSLETNVEDEITTQEIQDSVVSISSQPVDMTSVQKLVKDIMLGNDSLSRRQLRFAFDNQLINLNEITETNQTKSTKIEEIIQDLETVKSGSIT